MKRLRSPRTARIAGPLAVLSLLSLGARADSDELSAMAFVEAGVPVVGGTTSLTVRSPLIGASVSIATDTTLGPVFVFHPTLPVICLSSGRVTVASGVIDGTGRFSTTITTPSSGTTFYVQGQVVAGSGARFVTNCVTLTAGASTAASFVDGNAGLDADAALAGSSDVDWADIDKDGCPDALVSTALSVLVLNGGCNGTLTNTAAARLPAFALRPTSCVEVGDINNDSWPDLFLGGASVAEGPAPNYLLINDGSGFFTAGTVSAPAGAFWGAKPCKIDTECPSTAFPAGQGVAVDAEFGDVDGDDDLDILVTNVPDPNHPTEPTDSTTLYINQGGLQGGTLGRYVEATAFGEVSGNDPHTDGGGDSSMADVDNDGDLDILVVEGDSANMGAQNQLYVNDGLGNFTNVTATALPAEADNSFEADFGDFDNDGDLDMFVANSISSDPTAIHLYENVTATPDDPVFVDASLNVPATLGLTTNVRLSTDVGDIDCDGDLDVFVGIHELPGGAGPTDGEAVLLLNQGGLQGGTLGTFLVDSGFMPNLFVDADVALGDVDFDGDLDVYLASSGDLFQTTFNDQLLINQVK